MRRSTPCPCPDPAKRAVFPRGRVAIGLAALLTAGCAGPPPPESPPMRWPEPPQTVRIEFERTIANAADIAPEPTAWQRVALFLGLAEPEPTRPVAHPADLEFSPDGRTVYASDFAQGIVHAFDLESGETRYLGQQAPFARPFGLAVDPSGNLYVVEQEQRRIRVVDPSGGLLRTLPLTGVVRPVDVELDVARGRLYVADGARQASPEHYVRVFSLDGEALGTIGEGRGSRPGQLLFPTYLALDGDGRVYVSDTMNSRVAVFSPEGRFERMVGDRGDGPGFFDKPKGVALDAFDNLYVVDSSWSNVQIFGPGGDSLLFFGGRGGYGGYLRNPTGIAIAREGHRIVVGDYLNHRLSIYRLVNTSEGDGVPDARSAEPSAALETEGPR